MIEPTISRKLPVEKHRVNQKTADETALETNEKPTERSGEIDGRRERRHLDDTAEIFCGLFDGNEHYHTRDSAFVSLFG